MLKIAWAPVYAHPLPENHRFPMEKYNLLPEQLLYEGTIAQDNLFTPGPASDAVITTTHSQSYWEKLKRLDLSKAEERKTGFPLSAAIIRREATLVQGTLQASLFALQYGIGMNIAGGTHHAFTDRGEGFCFLNDMAISANYLLDRGLAKKILVIDLDVHQGNGTAEIFKSEPRIFTFSMHGAANYPLHKQKSDLDIGLVDHTDDRFYLKTLDETLGQLFDEVQPDFVFYQSGVDVLKSDKLGRLALSIAGCKERDKLVLEKCKQNAVPMTISMGGGYSEKISQIVEAHANTYRLAQHIFF